MYEKSVSFDSDIIVPFANAPTLHSVVPRYTSALSCSILYSTDDVCISDHPHNTKCCATIENNIKFDSHIDKGITVSGKEKSRWGSLSNNFHPNGWKTIKVNLGNGYSSINIAGVFCAFEHAELGSKMRHMAIVKHNIATPVDCARRTPHWMWENCSEISPQRKWWNFFKRVANFQGSSCITLWIPLIYTHIEMCSKTFKYLSKAWFDWQCFKIPYNVNSDWYENTSQKWNDRDKRIQLTNHCRLAIIMISKRVMLFSLNLHKYWNKMKF